METSTKALKHIIWDWNGTLFDDVFICADIMNQMLAKRKLPTLTIDDYKSHFCFPVSDYYQNVGWDFSKYPSEELSIEFIENYNIRRNECDLFNDAKKTLHFFKSKNYSQTVISAYIQTELRFLIS